MLSSRLVDYIKEMSDRALNCATLLLESHPSASSGRTCLLVEGLKEWGVGVVVRPEVGQ